MKVMPRMTGGPRQVSLKLKASEPSLRRAVVPLSKPGRAFGNGNGNGNGGAAVLQPSIEGNGKRHAEPEPAPAEEALESVGPVMESVGPIVEQGAMSAAAFTAPEWVSQPAEIPTFEMPQPVVTEPEPVVVPEVEPMFAQMATVAEPEIEPVGQGQPIPQLTPVEEPSIIEVTEPEPVGFEALRQPSEAFISPEPVIETPIYEPTTPVIMPEPIQIPTAQRGGSP